MYVGASFKNMCVLNFYKIIFLIELFVTIMSERDLSLDSSRPEEFGVARMHAHG